MLLQPVEPPYLHPDYEGPPRGHKHDGLWTDWEFQYADTPDANGVRWKLFRRYCQECGMLEYRNDREHLVTVYHGDGSVAGEFRGCAVTDPTDSRRCWWVNLDGTMLGVWIEEYLGPHESKRWCLTSPLLHHWLGEPQPYEIIVRFLW